MNIKVVGQQEFATTAADVIADHILTGRTSQICFATGKTPVETYKELVRRSQTGELNADKLKAFTLDEYVGLPLRHPRTCFYTLSTQLYDGLGLSPSQRFTFDMKTSPEDAANQYEQTIRDEGGLDLCVLGIGTNGHVGFNEPGTPRDSRAHVAQLAEATMERARLSGWLDVPSRGLTLGIASLFDAKSVLLMANGRHKADIVHRIVHGDISENIPASWFRQHPNCLLLLDEEAASRL
ncbi:glucosamine-6-phosphate deaminase [Alicyclobacillus shizuokensis]|uniref:glucosamine-6-phosphate deaminase n=1 Tax=Alicyclobacillus shizuokensis TaxID=392014 RepID=UPI0008337972|nr:glucosamine-6-phosphate deaminase [Alicyclobacillus shizuokensis]MCL6625256.1 glucosamine-6-phosphate deaminase [Alicyclobacillus shizuokensis]